MLRHKSHGTDMRNYKLCIKPDGDLALLDPSTEGFIFALITLRLKEPPRGEFRFRCQLGEFALDFHEDLPMNDSAAESDPVNVDESSGSAASKRFAKKFILMMPGTDLGLYDELSSKLPRGVHPTDNSLSTGQQPL